jgi:glutamate dehydrogenase/leucine dehydrogenase
VIDGLKGAYVTAEDIGTTCADMDLMSQFTRFAVGRSVENGGGGDPSPVTAESVFQALLRGLASATGSAELDGRRIGIVGLGKVGSVLGAKLSAGGAEILAYDLDPLRGERFRAEHGGQLAGSAEEVMAASLDVLAPCAAGGMIDERIARSLDCRVVAGAANNPLDTRATARILNERDILFVPDFLANCGGLIHVSLEWYGEHGPSEAELIAGAMDRLDLAIETAQAEGSPPIEVAERQALERIAAARP